MRPSHRRACSRRPEEVIDCGDSDVIGAGGLPQWRDHSESQAGISIRDRGFLLGDAVFDTTRTFQHKPFKLKEYIDRLYDSLAYLRIDPGLTPTEMSDLSMQVLEQNLKLIDDDGELWVTQRVTRGSRVFGLLRGSEVPTVLIECMEIPFQSRAWMFRDGIEVVTPSVRRTPPESISPRVKSHNYLNLILADLEVKTNNPDAFAVTLDINGNLCEGAGSNIFVVKDGSVRTPRLQYVRGGISRATALKLARKLDIDTSEADIDLFDAYTADEIFITSIGLCVCPVSKLNGTLIKGGCVPGAIKKDCKRPTVTWSGWTSSASTRSGLSRRRLRDPCQLSCP